MTTQYPKTEIKIIHFTKSKIVSIQYGADPMCRLYDLDVSAEELALELIQLHTMHTNINVQKYIDK
jgi:hypothetical protein